MSLSFSNFPSRLSSNRTISQNMSMFVDHLGSYPIFGSALNMDPGGYDDYDPMEFDLLDEETDLSADYFSGQADGHTTLYHPGSGSYDAMGADQPVHAGTGYTTEGGPGYAS